MKATTNSTRTEKRDALLEEAMKNPGVKEVMELYQATLRLQDVQGLQAVMQDVYVKTASDSSDALE